VPRAIFLPRKTIVKDILKKFKLNEDIFNNILGLLAVLLVVYLVWGYFKNINREQTSSANIEATASAQMLNLDKITKNDLPTTYEVQAGDSLWKIAESVYGSGYEWTKVYEANKEKIVNPNLLLVGTDVTLPKLETSTESTTEYTVVTGDSLWNISTKLCGNGFGWTQIAADNHLVNPGIIHKGNVLRVRCK
jgi:nucleoid-associated protein YgaU